MRALLTILFALYAGVALAQGSNAVTDAIQRKMGQLEMDNLALSTELQQEHAARMAMEQWVHDYFKKDEAHGNDQDAARPAPK